MKPLYLKMQAFGPFKGCCEIDFSLLKGGLFLVTGDTGSGKTTIFDAISFALFGAVSGGKERKNTKTLRSDFASGDVKTFVYYEFMYRNEIYKIERTPEYMRDKKHGTGQTKEIADATLTMPDGFIYTGVDTVTDKVIEILGVDKDRFSQIAMIAQGEFRKILTEKSKERAELFRKIFDTSLYEGFQKKLYEAFSKAEAERAHIQEKIGSLISECETEEVEFSNAYEAEEVLKALSVQHLKDSELLKEAEEAIEKSDEVLKEIHLKIENANEVNNLLKKVERLKDEVKALEARKNEINLKIEKYNNGLKANAVNVHFEKYQSAEKRLEQTNKELKDNLSLLTATEENKKLCDKDYNNALEKYKENDSLNKEKAELTALLENVGEYEIKKNDLNTKEKEYKAKREEYTKAQEEYNNIKIAYFDNLAGVLAKELEKGKPCPVCGSTSHPSVAVFSGKEVKKEDIDSAELFCSRIQNELNKSAESMNRLNGECGALYEKIKDKGVDLSNIENAKCATKEKLILLTKTIEENDNTFEKSKSSLEKVNKALAMLSGKKEVLEKARLDTEREIVLLKASYEAALDKNGFKDVDEFKEKVLSEAEMLSIREEVEQFTKVFSEKKAILSENEKSAEGKAYIETALLSEQEKTVMEEKTKKKLDRDRLNLRIAKNIGTAAAIEEAVKNRDAVDKKYVMLKELSDTANGKISGNKITFEAYVQQYYFSIIVQKANMRLEKMTGGRFSLENKSEGGTKGQGGLDLLVKDNNTGKNRDVSTLSGGEGFMASLSLALGLSDMISEKNGGIRLDTLFIDEGFGTLDENHLNKAIDVLSQLSDNERLVGIISHVRELKERIDKKIVVKRLTDTSSYATVEV